MTAPHAHLIPQSKHVFQISIDVLDSITQSLGTYSPETGGLLAGNREECRIHLFRFDNSASVTSTTYTPNAAKLTKILNKWDEEKKGKIIGFIHSHPGSYNRPSPGDFEYAERILKAIPALGKLFLPIATFRGDHTAEKIRFVINPYVAELLPSGKIKVSSCRMAIINRKGDKIGATVREWDKYIDSPFNDTPYNDDTFARVTGAYDTQLLRRCRVVAVGVGGAANYLEELARTGVGQFVLIDPDKVSRTNLATQQTYRKDIGKYKVKVLAARIRDINPKAEIVVITKKLDEHLSDSVMEQFIHNPVTLTTLDDFDPNHWSGGIQSEPQKTVLCALTDNFQAQSRVHRLALQFAVPCLSAAVYKEGRGAEVTFTHPDFTPACARCAQSSRYKAYESGDKIQEVTSDGTPIFATTRLNALKGYVTLALLHAGSHHPRWSKLLEPVKHNNLVLIRLDPGFSTVFNSDVFERNFGRSNNNIYFDETVWTKVTPDNGKNGNDLCADCHGLGNLRAVAGSFKNTITGERQPA